jgi:hypothetical protein
MNYVDNQVAEAETVTFRAVTHEVVNSRNREALDSSSR